MKEQQINIGAGFFIGGVICLLISTLFLDGILGQIVWYMGALNMVFGLGWLIYHTFATNKSKRSKGE